MKITHFFSHQFPANHCFFLFIQDNNGFKGNTTSKWCPDCLRRQSLWRWNWWSLQGVTFQRPKHQISPLFKLLRDQGLCRWKCLVNLTENKWQVLLQTHSYNDTAYYLFAPDKLWGCVFNVLSYSSDHLSTCQTLSYCDIWRLKRRCTQTTNNKQWLL